MIEVVDVHRHAAEKLHAMLHRVGERENSRIRDLVDVVILHEHGLLDVPALAVATRGVWRERDGADPPAALPPFPDGWPGRYERAAGELGLGAATFAEAALLVGALWRAMVDETG